MQLQISGEKPFRCYSNAFAVSPSAEGYELAYSADNETWTKYSGDAVPAGETLIVNGCPNECIFKLVGNESTVKVLF